MCFEFTYYGAGVSVVPPTDLSRGHHRACTSSTLRALPAGAAVATVDAEARTAITMIVSGSGRGGGVGRDYRGKSLCLCAIHVLFALYYRGLMKWGGSFGAVNVDRRKAKSEMVFLSIHHVGIVTHPALHLYLSDSNQ